jgi:hypothetical protein
MPAHRTPAEQAALDAAAEAAIALAEAGEAHAAEQKAKFLEPKLPLGAITEGLSIPEFTTRNWLTRKQLDLSSEGDRARGKWRLFSMRDAVVLSVAHQLSRVGVPVSVFAPIAAKIGDYAADAARIMMFAPPTVVLFNDGEWKHDFMSKHEASQRDGLPAAVVVLDINKVIVDTLRALGIRATIGTASDLERAIEEMKKEETK